MGSRNRTPLQIIGYGLYLYFLGLSFRNTAKALSFLKIIKISHVSIWHWIQKYKPKRFLTREIKEYIVDETADVVLMNDDLTKIPHLIKSSRNTIFTIRQNFF